jgi:hypothetical protein
MRENRMHLDAVRSGADDGAYVGRGANPAQWRGEHLHAVGEMSPSPKLDWPQPPHET